MAAAGVAAPRGFLDRLSAQVRGPARAPGGFVPKEKRVARKKRYLAPKVRRRDRLAKAAEGAPGPITERGVTVITPP